MSKNRNGLNGMGSSSSAPWAEERGPRIASLLASGQFCDVYLVVGQPPERIPAAQILLAAASPPLELRMQALDRTVMPLELELSDVSSAAAQAIVAYSCGIARPFDSCSPADARAARDLLRSGYCGASAKAAEESPAAVVASDSANSLSVWQTGWRVVALGLCCSCLLVASLTAFLPVRHCNLQLGGFFMDDVMIHRNLVVVSETMDWGRLWRTDYWGLEMFDPNTWTHKSFRPLVVLTFRWNYFLHGFSSAGFHFTNVVMHACASAQLGYLGCRALHLPALWGAMLAVLFAVHPVHTENICYIVGRADILCTQVLLFAVQAYERCGTGSCGPVQGFARLLIAVVLIITSGLCKETGFTFFGLLVIWEVLGMTRTRSLRFCAWRWARVIIVLLIGSASCVARFWYTSGTAIARMDPYSNPIAAASEPNVRIMSYALVHGMYMKLLVWPWFLCYDYSMDAVPLVRNLGDLRLLLPFAGYLGIVQIGCHVLRKLRQWRAGVSRGIAEGAALGVVIFVLSFLPMMNILFPIGTLVGERLLYIPSIGFIVVLVCLLHLGTRGSRLRNIMAWLSLLALAGFWWVLCYQRVNEWRNVERITEVDGLKQLRSTRTQFNLGNFYLQDQRMDEALIAYQRANSLDPEERDSMPLYHAGQILLYKGQYAEAEQHLHKAVSGYFSPLTLHEEEVWHDYGLALWYVGRGVEAAQNFQNAIITNPNFPKAYNNMACALVMLGLGQQPPERQFIQDGLQHMEQALAMSPGMALYWRNAAVLLGLVNDQSASMGAWDRFRQMDPSTAAAVEAGGALPRDCIWEFHFR